MRANCTVSLGLREHETEIKAKGPQNHWKRKENQVQPRNSFEIQRIFCLFR